MKRVTFPFNQDLQLHVQAQVPFQPLEVCWRRSFLNSIRGQFYKDFLFTPSFLKLKAV